MIKEDSQMAKKVVLAGACRTAIGTMGGTLSTTPAAELGAIVIKEALNSAGVKPEDVDQVYMGCVIQLFTGKSPLTANIVCGGNHMIIVKRIPQSWMSLR